MYTLIHCIHSTSKHVLIVWIGNRCNVRLTHVPNTLQLRTWRVPFLPRRTQSQPTLAPRSCARRPVHARKTPPKRLYNVMHTPDEAYNSSIQTIYYTKIYAIIWGISYDKRVAGHKTAALALAGLIAAIEAITLTSLTEVYWTHVFTLNILCS